VPCHARDKAAVLASVRKTGRLVVAHESVSVGGFGAEIVATVAQNELLKARPVRIGAPRGSIAYAYAKVSGPVGRAG